MYSHWSHDPTLNFKWWLSNVKLSPNLSTVRFCLWLGSRFPSRLLATRIWSDCQPRNWRKMWWVACRWLPAVVMFHVVRTLWLVPFCAWNAAIFVTVNGSAWFYVLRRYTPCIPFDVIYIFLHHYILYHALDFNIFNQSHFFIYQVFVIVRYVIISFCVDISI